MRGRPLKSDVRENIIDLLFLLKEAHGYEIYKFYNALFPKVSQRLIYYHLRKGISTGDFEISRIKSEDGNFSWGSKSERVYYKLSGNARPNPDKKIIVRFNKLKDLIKNKKNFEFKKREKLK
ncbi:MAG: hypothetical protein QXU20_00505 [Candidatus Woesearchaeota archaeon]